MGMGSLCVPPKDGSSVGVSSGGTAPSGGLNINMLPTELSHWGIAELITWDRALSSSELSSVGAYLQALLDEGTDTELINSISVGSQWSFGATSREYWTVALGTTTKFALSSDGEWPLLMWPHEPHVLPPPLLMWPHEPHVLPPPRQATHGLPLAGALGAACRAGSPYVWRASPPPCTGHPARRATRSTRPQPWGLRPPACPPK